MKTIIITLILIQSCFTGISQNMNFEIRGTYSHPVLEASLHDAKTIADISSGYPSQWITDYISSEIAVTNHGKSTKVSNSNDQLSVAQKNLLLTAGLDSEIEISIRYYHKNPATGLKDVNTFNTTLTVIPELEAQYPGGEAEMKQYLKKNAINKINGVESITLPTTIIRFTVNEQGGIANAQVSQTSNDSTIDKLLLEAITKMPKWKPAENAHGVKVKQDFEFSVGNTGC